MRGLWTVPVGACNPSGRRQAGPPTPTATGGSGTMAERNDRPDPDRDREEADRRTAGLAAIVVVLVLLIGGLMLARVLHDKSKLEDCLMAGRRDCRPAAAGAALRGSVRGLPPFATGGARGALGAEGTDVPSAR